MARSERHPLDWNSKVEHEPGDVVSVNGQMNIVLFNCVRRTYYGQKLADMSTLVAKTRAIVKRSFRAINGVSEPAEANLSLMWSSDER